MKHLKSYIFYGGQKQFQKHVEKLENLFLSAVRTAGRIGGPIPQIAGTKIACNFYKVCEGGNAEQNHYASYSPVDVPEPDFHRPEFFETGELQ